MAQYKFEGEVDNISERQLEFINKVIVDLGFTDRKVTFELVGQAGDNYAASVKRIVIESENETLRMIVKVAPANEYIRLVMNSDILFRNEHIMYTEVLPKMRQLQIEAEVPQNEQLKFAKCYGSFAEQPDEVILLEDLKTLDFVMLDRFESLSNDCVLSVLKNFGIFHSLSFVLKKNEPDTFDSYKANLGDMWAALAKSEDTVQNFKVLEEGILKMFDDREYKDILKNKIAGVLPLATNFLKVDESNKYSVIQQGDSWTNNIMFRFEEGTLKESMLIDYQVSKNSSPASDLLYMIFNCTDHEIRSKHFHDWIDYYHSELNKSLSNFGLKANFVYPRDQLDADLKLYAKLMFGYSAILANVLTMKPADASKIKEAMESASLNEVQENMDMSSLDIETFTRFKKRMIGLMESYKQFGLL